MERQARLGEANQGAAWLGEAWQGVEVPGFFRESRAFSGLKS
jgi:hypothetical protein